ncbi:hypothetical protein EDF51_106119 [Curtobacterium sp. PhB25]|uniref:hypothetical protein n=1 Tax=Curtobacterium sp. PhB25 TaxID=2485205 RepID=UPI0010D8016F|nr:hypothetical protein [Curtobacterium sp. PhB25]TDW69135.1 hypothetical protein EDF51_106119 [Curtobacterium sp. PhB25]
MSDENKAAGDLAPRSWRNFHRSRRAHEMRQDLAAENDYPEPTDWWLTDDERGDEQ